MPSELPETPFHETTESLCPACLRTVPAVIFQRDGKIWMESNCPDHGETVTLLASDAAEYIRLRHYTPARMGMAGGCCGSGESCDTDGPPVCVLLLEITLACNLRCPTCYADAHGHDFMSLDEVRARLDGFFKSGIDARSAYVKWWRTDYPPPIC